MSRRQQHARGTLPSGAATHAAAGLYAARTASPHRPTLPPTHPPPPFSPPQFVDGMCVVCSVQQRKIGFLVARKSYNTPLVGFFARVLAAVPVTRPQDIAFKGSIPLCRLEQ